MLTTSTFLAASSLFSIAFTAPIPTPSLTKRAFSYTKFGGNGTPDQGWPYEAEWKGKFETLWYVTFGHFQFPNLSTDIL